MKNYLFGISIFLVIAQAHGQLKIINDSSTKNFQNFFHSPRMPEIEKYVEKNGASSKRFDGSIDKPGLTAVTSRTEYKWKFKNTEFLSYVSAFRTNLTPPPSCRPGVPFAQAMDGAECEHAITAFVQCHLFLISSSKRLVAVQPLYIPQPDFIEAKPSCFDVYAMAPAKVVNDGMLIVAGYYDSRWTCNSGWYCASNSPAASPDPLYKTTFLVRFSEDDQGQLTLSQDDKCMPLLNNYDTIAKARHALKKNGCH